LLKGRDESSSQGAVGCDDSENSPQIAFDKLANKISWLQKENGNGNIRNFFKQQ
jgi:hypothetical protein